MHGDSRDATLGDCVRVRGAGVAAPGCTRRRREELGVGAAKMLHTKYSSTSKK